jgi:hypothetical protein
MTTKYINENGRVCISTELDVAYLTEKHGWDSTMRLLKDLADENIKHENSLRSKLFGNKEE